MTILAPEPRDRVVAKYAMTESELTAVLAQHHLQQTSVAHLVTIYFDDPDGRMYADHFRKTDRRFKVRLRKRDDVSVVEVKLKGGHGEKLRQLPAAEYDASAQQFVRACLDSAFEPGFAAGIEGKLKPVVTTSFQRTVWQLSPGEELLVDRDLVLQRGERKARLAEGFVVVEILSGSKNGAALRLFKHSGHRRVRFSKFTAALDLLQSDRAKAHNPELLRMLFDAD